MAEANLVMDYIEARAGKPTPRPPLSRAEFLQTFAKAASDHFDPDLHLDRIGVANQTTMLARESLAIGAAVGDAMARAYGEGHRSEHFRTFDTICSATQDRQDAVVELLAEPLDLMVVVGGYNSSNTISLAALCAEQVPTYHIADPDEIDVAGCPRRARYGSGSPPGPARRTTRSARPWRMSSPFAASASTRASEGILRLTKPEILAYERHHGGVPRAWGYGRRLPARGCA
jgi:hypothetical protein